MKGLSFSEPMMKAWMEGRKTVTRRLMNPQPVSVEWWLHGGRTAPGIGGYLCRDENGAGWSDCGKFKPRYLPSETVYIKETWVKWIDDVIYYKASENPENAFKWKSPRFMPFWAARSHARIVSVRPERIREITIADVRDEGIPQHGGYAITSFYELWESLYPGSWEKNDWCWVYTLKKKP